MVSVKIKDNILDVDNKPITISNLVAKGVSGLTLGGGGVISFSCEPFEDVVQKGFSKVIGDKDRSLMDRKNVCVNLLEQAIYDTKDKTLCFDASTASVVEKPRILTD